MHFKINERLEIRKHFIGKSPAQTVLAPALRTWSWDSSWRELVTCRLDGFHTLFSKIDVKSV